MFSSRRWILSQSRQSLSDFDTCGQIELQNLFGDTPNRSQWNDTTFPQTKVLGPFLCSWIEECHELTCEAERSAIKSPGYS